MRIPRTSRGPVLDRTWPNPSWRNTWSGMPRRPSAVLGTMPNRPRSKLNTMSRTATAQIEATNTSSQTNAGMAYDPCLERLSVDRTRLKPPKRSLRRPFMSSYAVLTMRTLLSGSSAHLTGISLTL